MLKLKNIPTLTLVSCLAACGGGGGGSDDSAAQGSIPGTNESINNSSSALSELIESLSKAVPEVAKRAISSENKPSLNQSRSSSRTAFSRTAFTELEDSGTIPGDCGGTAEFYSKYDEASAQRTFLLTALSPEEEEYEGDEDYPEDWDDEDWGDEDWYDEDGYDEDGYEEDELDLSPMSDEFSMTFNDFCTTEEGYQITFNGSMSFTADFVSIDEYSYGYHYDMSYVSNNPVEPTGVIQEFEQCVKTVEMAEEECTSSSFYEDESGEDYILDGAEVTGSAEEGYNLEGTITEEGVDYTVKVEALKFCEDGRIQSGKIAISSETEEDILIDFPSCEEMVVTYDGVTEMFSQEIL